MSEITEKDFKLERYKFLNGEISSLNKNVHNYLNQFQTICSAIIIATTLVIINYKSVGIEGHIAKLCVRALTFLLLSISVFTSFRIITSIFSWWDYRKEEVRLLDDVIKTDYRRSPTIKNFWRWDELYSFLLILSIGIVYTILSFRFFIPLIK